MDANYTLANELDHDAVLTLSTRATNGPTSIPPVVLALVTFFPAHVHTKQISAAFLTWVVYEILITTGESVELFWKQRWNLSKALFFTNQYVGLFTVILNTLVFFAYRPSSKFCSIVPWLGLVGGFIIVFVISLTMLLRVTALWNRSRLVKIVTTGLFFINMAHFIIFAAHGYAKGIIIPMPVVPYTGCRIVLDHRLPLYTIFLVPLLFDTSIVIFTVLKSYPLVVQNLRSLDGGMFRLSSVLFNDGVAYYIAIIISQAISLYAALSVESNPNVAIPMARAAPPIAVTIVAGNRLLLRLRDVMLMREDEDGRMRRVANRGGVRPSTGGTAAVSAGVSVASPTDPSSMGSSSGTGEGGVHLQHPSNANRVQFSNQLATVDYDYHKYLREDLNHASTSSSSKKGGLPGMAGMESRYRHRPSSERSGLDEIAMTNLRDGSGKKPMFSA